jgi:hypothetical protein
VENKGKLVVNEDVNTLPRQYTMDIHRIILYFPKYQSAMMPPTSGIKYDKVTNRWVTSFALAFAAVVELSIFE